MTLKLCHLSQKLSKHIFEKFHPDHPQPRLLQSCLVFMPSGILRGGGGIISVSQEVVLIKFSFWQGGWVLGYYSMKF